METDDLKPILASIIDNQIMLINQQKNIIEILSKLTNTIIKYDNEYQQEITKG